MSEKQVSEIRECVMELLSHHMRRAWTATELATELKLEGKTKKTFQKRLQELVVDGSIVNVRGDRYSLGAAADLASGNISIARSGNGYLSSPDLDRDLFIPQSQMGVALPGDRVLARIEAPTGRHKDDPPVGRIIRVLERRKRDIVGTLKSTGRFNYIIPTAPGYTKNFYVTDTLKAKVGDRVVVRFIDWPNKHVNPEAEIIDIIGPADDPSVDTISIIRQYELPGEFPDAVTREAEDVAASLDRPGQRRDLRETLIITIDPERARDFDDALSLEQDAKGRRVLGVHIADVSHFVEPGSALDDEARLRGNSVYLPDKVIPMLPEQLSNGVCSLRPNEDRLAFSAFLTVDDAGTVVAREFARTIIRSKVRFTYEEAMARLQRKGGGRGRGKGSTGSGATTPELKDSGEVLKLLQDVHALAQQFRRKRFSRYALDISLPEVEILYDGDGQIRELRAAVNDESHQLVEECMVAANEAVDLELSEKGVPLVHRYHARPDKQRLEDLTAELEDMGYSPGNLGSRRALARFLKQLKDDPLSFHAQVAVLKSMSRAEYSASEAGHYGLAKAFYAHFTSPIRRYPDLLVHRQLGALLLGEKQGLYAKPALAAAATDCSKTERTAEEAERDLLEIKKMRFLAAQIERKDLHTYEAVVAKVMNFGIFVDIPQLQLGGLVHVSSLSDRFVRFDQSSECLRDGKTIYARGTRLQVVVSGVDFDNRRVDFAPADRPGAGRSREGRRPRRQGQGKGPGQKQRSGAGKDGGAASQSRGPRRSRRSKR